MQICAQCDIAAYRFSRKVGSGQRLLFNRVRQKLNRAPATKKFLINIKTISLLRGGLFCLCCEKIVAFVAAFLCCFIVTIGMMPVPRWGYFGFSSFQSRAL